MDASTILELEQTLPAVISRAKVSTLLGGLISSGRMANLDSEGRGPRRINLGRNVGYLRADFIAWMQAREAEKAARPKGKASA